MDDKTEDAGLEETRSAGGAPGNKNKDNEASGKKTLSRKAKIGIAVGCAAVAAVVGIAAFALTNQATTLPADEPVESSEPAAGTGDEALPQKVTLGYEGYEAQDGDTPVIAHVTGTAADDGAVDFYHAVSGAEGDVELEPGAYQVEYLPVLAKDGSMVSAKDGSAVAANVAGEPVAAKADASSKAADQVTADDVKDLLDKVEQAVAKGDETLKGDAGKDVASKVAEAAKATGKVDADKVEEVEKKAEAASDSAATSSTPTDSSQVVSSRPSNGSSTGAGVTLTSNANQSAHEHNWEPITEQRITGYKTVTDQEAYTSREVTGSVVVCVCGQRFNTTSDWIAHVKASGDFRQ